MSAQCYDWHADSNSAEKLPIGVWVQCPETLGCCVAGDSCLDYNICHTTNSANPDTGGSYSQYYIQRCSDPTYTSPDCQKVCDPPGPPDVVYNFSTQQWACCGDDSTGNVSCNAPTNEIFQAPAPAQLAVISSGASVASTATIVPGPKTSTNTMSSSNTASSSETSTTSSAVSTDTSASSSTASNPSVMSQSTSSSLSTGAEAGIGVGVAIAVLASIALIAFVLLRRRKERSNISSIPSKNDTKDPIYFEKATDTTRPELSSEQQPLSTQGHNTTAKSHWHQPIHELDNEN